MPDKETINRLRNPLASLFLFVGFVLEFLLLTSLANGYRRSGHEFGVWAVHMSGNTAKVVSFIAAAFIVVAFVEFLIDFNVIVSLGIILACSLIELLWGNELPPPQDQWVVGVAFLLGLFYMLVRGIRNENFVKKVRDRFGTSSTPAATS